jgi:peptide chain release factor 1
MISVAILPLTLREEFVMNDSDLEIKTQRGHGKGGQHQNKTDSAVRMRHIPTGLSVFINGRDQHQNKEDARAILSTKVKEFYNNEKNKATEQARLRQLDGGGRSNKIRTYNFISNVVIDHRLEKQVNDVKQIMKGKFDLLIKS